MPWKKNFDVDVALERARDAFWNNGYEATSMRDLLDAMGIQKGSFYDTYGSKKAAYMATLERYGDEAMAGMRARADGLSPRAALEMWIGEILDSCAGPDGHRGCMVINCALELGHSDIDAQRFVQRALETHEALYAERIAEAQAAGEIDAGLDPAATAKALLAIVMGMRVYSRSGAPRGTLRTLADQARALLGT